MPKLRRQKLPRALIQHLSLRIRQREISIDQMGLFGEWCDTDPEVPEGEWYKRFPGMTVCGEGELVKTFLLPGQAPHGAEVV
jgi:hypothetical protein